MKQQDPFLNPFSSSAPITTIGVFYNDLRRQGVESGAIYNPEIRRFRFCPIVIEISQDVPEYLAQASIAGVKDALKASGQKRELIIQRGGVKQFEYEAARSPYTRKANGYGQQLDANQMLQLLRIDPSQELNPCWKVMITAKDLRMNQATNNFVFGLTDPTYPSSVQSIARIWNSGLGANDQSLIMRRILRHEVGHMFGAATRKQFVESEQLGQHCASNVCSMKQGLTLEDWLSLGKNEEKTGILFCKHCRTELDQINRALARTDIK